MRLLKYDFLSQMSVILPGIGLALIATVVNMILYFFIENIDFENGEIVYYSLVIAHTITIYAVNALIFYGFFMISSHFYRGIYGKEGYLTHTLPIKTSTILQSRMMVGFVSMFLCLAVVALMNCMIYIQNYGSEFIFQQLSPLDREIFLIIASAILIQGVTQLSAMYLSMALAHLTKHPVPWTVVFYLILNNTIVFLPLTITFVLLYSINTSFSFYLLSYALLSGVLCYAFYCITLSITTKKLNLV